MPSSRGSYQLRDRTQVSCIAGGFFTVWTPGKPVTTGVGSLSCLKANFPTQQSNWGLLNCRQVLYQLSYKRSPKNMLICNFSQIICLWPRSDTPLRQKWSIKCIWSWHSQIYNVEALFWLQKSGTEKKSWVYSGGFQAIVMGERRPHEASIRVWLWW